MGDVVGKGAKLVRYGLKYGDEFTGLARFVFRGARRIDGLREATHADIVKAFAGTGFIPRGHFIMRLKDVRTYDLGVRTFEDLQAIFRHGELVDAEEGVVAIVYRGLAVLFDPQTRHLIDIRPW